MASSSIDHMVALTIFVVATLLFIGLFNQTIQTAVVYQNHRATATKASDILDTILLNPGTPSNWGITGVSPTGFGVQDPEFTQYKLDAFSLMRLDPYDSVIYYQKANNQTGMSYNSLSDRSGGYLYMPASLAVTYSTAQKLMGINGSYGFQLTLTPVLTVTVTNSTSGDTPLTLNLRVDGTGFPLANAKVNYKLFLLSLNSENEFPAFKVYNGTSTTDITGSAVISFPSVKSSQSYAFIASVQLSGLNGVGYKVNNAAESPHVIPLINNIDSQQIILAHSGDIAGDDLSPLTYNTTMVNFNSQDFSLQELKVDAAGILQASAGYPYGEVTLSTEPAILIIGYNSSAAQGGFSLMSWGLNALSNEITFGPNPANVEWVSTDMRQVTVGGVTYHAKISVWSYKGIQVNQ